jgi:hypothetical protein
MEGLAQTTLRLLAGADELPAPMRLRDRVNAFHQAVLNEAQLDLEEGIAIEAVIAAATAAAPLLSPASVASSMQQRSRDPLHRCYLFVYCPSRVLFDGIVTLGRIARTKTMSVLYQTLRTSEQLAQIIEAHRGAT